MDITKALQTLRPNANWVLSGDTYDCLEWTDKIQTKPTEEEIIAECKVLDAQRKASAYQRKRAAEYPPITDYLDGVVKGDQAQIDAYIAACQAVKAKYPKGTA